MFSMPCILLLRGLSLPLLRLPQQACSDMNTGAIQIQESQVCPSMSTGKSVAVGVELAGRGTTVALVDRRGHVRHRLYARTLLGRPAIPTIEPSLRAIETMLSYALTQGFKIL